MIVATSAWHGPSSPSRPIMHSSGRASTHCPFNGPQTSKVSAEPKVDVQRNVGGGGGITNEEDVVDSVRRCSMNGRLDLRSCMAPSLSSLNRTLNANKCNAKHDCESSCGLLATTATNWRVRLLAASSCRRLEAGSGQ
eukprot:786836-Pleurochrysis_carterae.AAC.3